MTGSPGMLKVGDVVFSGNSTPIGYPIQTDSPENI